VAEIVEFVLQEDSGRLKFLCYSNDGVDEHMIWCVALLITLFGIGGTPPVLIVVSSPGWLV
jgi:hypothetical protein